MPKIYPGGDLVFVGRREASFVPGVQLRLGSVTLAPEEITTDGRLVRFRMPPSDTICPLDNNGFQPCRKPIPVQILVPEVVSPAFMLGALPQWPFLESNLTDWPSGVQWQNASEALARGLAADPTALQVAVVSQPQATALGLDPASILDSTWAGKSSECPGFSCPINRTLAYVTGVSGGVLPQVEIISA